MRRGNNAEGTWAAAQKEEPRRKNDDTIKLVVEEDPGAEEEIYFESPTVVQLKERLKLAGLTEGEVVARTR